MTRGDAKRMLDFLMAVVPARFKLSERLISSDLQSNVYNYKVSAPPHGGLCEDNMSVYRQRRDKVPRLVPLEHV